MDEATKDSDTFEKEPHTTIHRLAQRASYEKKTIYSILDEAFICHISYVNDDG